MKYGIIILKCYLKKFILSMVDELDILVKQGKLNEFNPLNDMNKVITIQDMSEKKKKIYLI